MKTPSRLRHVPAATGALIILVLVPVTRASASGWPVGVIGGSAGQAAAGVLAVPTGAAATCGAGTKVVVTWSAVTGAASYRLQVSNTSATSGFSNTATGVTGTSWTSGNLGNGKSYWFRVKAVAGSWTSAASPATAQRTISGGACG